MFRLLIFGGTTEGRLLAEYCAENGIMADISVTTDYGASLLPENSNILCGRLDSGQIRELLAGNGYSMVIDATHPYAVEATKNIRCACDDTNMRYIRLVRKSAVSSGITVRDMDELVSLLDKTDGIILSTLGSKSLSALTKVRNYRERIWVRVLPSEDILEQCRELGYDTAKVIQEKGPFTIEQNIEHLKKCGADVLVTKESGETGGYAEKAKAAEMFGAELITLLRPAETGQSLEEIKTIIGKELTE